MVAIKHTKGTADKKADKPKKKASLASFFDASPEKEKSKPAKKTKKAKKDLSGFFGSAKQAPGAADLDCVLMLSVG